MAIHTKQNAVRAPTRMPIPKQGIRAKTEKKNNMMLMQKFS